MMYKLGTVVKDKKVVDIKRIWHVSLIHVMRQMEEYRNQGYELDLSSVRDLGIQKQLNMAIIVCPKTHYLFVICIDDCIGRR